MLHAVIMAGGSGTRFWPVSRRDRPKQLLDLVSGAPLLRLTYERLAGLVPPERVWVITNQTTAEACRRVLPEVPGANILAEPVGRNTAACVGLAAHAVGAGDDDAVCLVLPADHLIGDDERFRSAMAAGADAVARDGGLLTFGIQPTRPETGYGYLEIGEVGTQIGRWPVCRLEAFVEKPDLDRARGYLESGCYLWNAGIFAWRARDLLTEMERQLPDLAAGLARIGAAISGPDAAAVLAETYPSLPTTSVDFGIMEGAERSWVVPVDFPWSDVGSWPALADELPTDDRGNATRGRTAAIDAAGNVLVSTGPVLAVMGVDDLVVVATPDAVLVIPKDQAQRVKEVVDRLHDLRWDDVL
jgi:mannose-1-phosphate guanylyltransferase